MAKTRQETLQYKLTKAERILTMNQQPHFVSPDEIIEFLDQQAISEEKATGLRLLRRAAQTIEHQTQKIEQLEQERIQHLEAIQQRDDVIAQADQELQRLNRDPVPSPVAAPEQIEQDVALQEAEMFGHALIGLSYTNGLPDWVVSGAQGIIEYSKNN